MIRMIDRALLLVLLAVLAGLAAHILSLTVGAVLTMSMTPVADALDHVLRITAIGRRG
jgi:hypothetical protein